MSVLAVFPGQGSQKVSMGADLLANFSYVKYVFQQAEDTLKLSLSKLCFQGPDDKLTISYHAQPAVLMVSVAYFKVLLNESGFKCSYFAGHSLGEISALVCSEKISFAEALNLVYKRGLFMQRSCDNIFDSSSKGFMSAVLGIDQADLELLCDHVNESLKSQKLFDNLSFSDDSALLSANINRHYVQIANINSSDQIVVSGSNLALNKLKELIKDKHHGLFDPQKYQRSIKVLPLKVSAPFHSVYMQYSKEKLAPLIRSIDFNDQANDLTKNAKSSSFIIANTTGKVADPYTHNHLIDQICSAVQWYKTKLTAQSLGINFFLEVGDSTVLTNMFKKDPKVKDEEKFFSAKNIKDVIAMFS